MENPNKELASILVSLAYGIHSPELNQRICSLFNNYEVSFSFKQRVGEDSGLQSISVETPTRSG